MRFSIGYQLPDEADSTVELVRDYRDHVGEVYFAMPGHASGRSPLGMVDGEVETDAAEVMDEELTALAEIGVGLVLLLNAACYGDEAVSEALAQRTRDLVGDLSRRYGLNAVTTTSPFLARVIKKDFPAIEVRASVNMRIGTIKGMEYLRDLFDGFYMQREFNRDPARITELKQWCDANGKRLHLLANSGCLNYCSSQSFHDNLVAHEAGVSAQRNVPARFPSHCWEVLSNKENWPFILQSSWIRPEDLASYEPWFPIAKLATRMHANPRKVIAAYARGRYHGNLLDLMEPGYGPLFKGCVLDNSLFPDDWMQQVTSCDKACHRCQYCQSVLDRVLVNVEEYLQSGR